MRRLSVDHFAALLALDKFRPPLPLCLQDQVTEQSIAKASWRHVASGVAGSKTELGGNPPAQSNPCCTIPLCLLRCPPEAQPARGVPAMLGNRTAALVMD